MNKMSSMTPLPLPVPRPRIQKAIYILHLWLLSQSHSNLFQTGCVVSAWERTSFQKQTSKAENMPTQKNFSGKTVRFVETGKFPVV